MADTLFRPFVDACDSPIEDRVRKVFEVLLTPEGAAIVNAVEVSEEHRSRQLQAIEHYRDGVGFKAPEIRGVDIYKPCLRALLTKEQIEALNKAP